MWVKNVGVHYTWQNPPWGEGIHLLTPARSSLSREGSSFKFLSKTSSKIRANNSKRKQLQNRPQPTQDYFFSLVALTFLPFVAMILRLCQVLVPHLLFGAFTSATKCIIVIGKENYLERHWKVIHQFLAQILWVMLKYFIWIPCLTAELH